MARVVLQPGRTYLALHHHFDSVDDAIRNGTDMIPEIQELKTYPAPRRISDTERGSAILRQITLLELLIRAYRENKIEQGKG